MKKYIKSSVNIFGMANLYPKRTGLPVIIWVDSVGIARNNKHYLPRVKIQNTPGNKATLDTFSVLISKTPRILSGKCKLSSDDLQTMFNYVSEHCQDLMDLWNQKIDEDELKERLYK